MPDDVILDDAAGGSSTATADQTADPSQATRQPASAEGLSQSRTVPYERFQEVNSKMRTYESQLAQAGQQVQQLQREMAEIRAAQHRGQGLTAEQQRQYLEAGDALEQILAAHPRLKALMGLMQHAPKLIEGYQGVSQLTEVQAQRHTMAAREAVRGLAEQAGLPITGDQGRKYLDRLTRLVAMEVRAIEGGEQRYEQGDLSVLTEAFQGVLADFVNHTRREANASLATTKTRTKALPPAATHGTAPGEPAPPKLVPGKEREFEEAMHARARKLLASLTG